MKRENMSHRLTVRVTPSEYEHIRLLAEAEGVTPSVFIRHAVDGLIQMSAAALPVVEGLPSDRRAALEFLTAQLAGLAVQVENLRAEVDREDRAAS